MLILSRKAGESIVIDGRIHVQVMRVEGETVKIGVQAPSEVPVHRQEVYAEIQRSNQEALARQSSALPKLPQAAKDKVKMKNAKNLAAPSAAMDSGTIRPAGHGVTDHAPRTGPGLAQ